MLVLAQWKSDLTTGSQWQGQECGFSDSLQHHFVYLSSTLAYLGDGLSLTQYFGYSLNTLALVGLVN